MIVCIKQHLSNIWSSIYENTEAELEKSVTYKKERVSGDKFKFFWLGIFLSFKSIAKVYLCNF